MQGGGIVPSLPTCHLHSNENGLEVQTFGIPSPLHEQNNQQGLTKTTWTHNACLMSMFLRVNSHHSMSWHYTPKHIYVQTPHTHTHTRKSQLTSEKTLVPQRIQTSDAQCCALQSPGALLKIPMRKPIRLKWRPKHQESSIGLGATDLESGIVQGRRGLRNLLSWMISFSE